MVGGFLDEDSSFTLTVIDITKLYKGFKSKTRRHLTTMSSTELVALTPQSQGQTLMRPIATPKDLIHYHEEMTQIIREALKEGTDYGRIPNTNKPTLYKAGAERINLAFGTHPEYELIEKEINHDRENKYFDKYKKENTSFGLYRYVYKCRIVKADGRVIGEGEGVCSTLEAKYISRPRDAENTACKMAQKRAFLAATLHSFGLSDRFTQDLEDMEREMQVPRVQQAHQAPAPGSAPILLFNVNDPKHLDRLEKILIELNVPVDQHDAIALAYNGHPISRENLLAVISSLQAKKDEIPAEKGEA